MPLAQTIGLETLSKYFHLPINDVAKELGVCATVLKKICRKNGIPRWPHRKIKSLDKMIMTLEVSVAKNPEDGERIRHEIHTLKNKKMFLMKNPNVLATKAPNMKKGLKAGKGDKSPIDSPESPMMGREHPHHPPYPFAYPYGNYPDPQYPHHMYAAAAAYHMYHAAAAANYKGVPPPPYAYYPYPPPPPPYPMEHMDHHRRPMTEEECMSPSMVLDPVAAAMFLQIPHPHIPHPAVMARTIESPSERSQWVPSDHNPSAFTPKSSSSSLRHPQAKVSPSSQPPQGYHPDLYVEQAHMVPQHSPVHHAHHSPSSHGGHHSPVVHHPPPSDYLIHLPELRLPDEKEKPKTLSTLEPGVVAPSSPSNNNNNTNNNNTNINNNNNNNNNYTPSNTQVTSTHTPPSNSPSSSPSHSNKWPIPEWFEAEQQLMRKEPFVQQKGYRMRMQRTHSVDAVAVPSGDRTPPSLE